jgi:hypothetical protein
VTWTGRELACALCALLWHSLLAFLDMAVRVYASVQQQVDRDDRLYIRDGHEYIYISSFE